MKSNKSKYEVIGLQTTTTTATEATEATTTVVAEDDSSRTVAADSSDGGPSPPPAPGAGFWPIFYLASWFLLNIVITLYCKSIFSVYSFPYPMLLTAVHMLFTSIGVFACQLFGVFVPAAPTRELFRTMLWFSVIFTVNIWLSNAGLLAVSVNLHQVGRTLVPLFTMGISATVFREKYPLTLLPSVLVVIAGVALTVWGDEMEVTFYGLFIVLLGCVFSSLKGIVTQKTQVGHLGMSSLDLLRWLCPLAVFQLLLVATLNGEISDFVENTMRSAPATLSLHLMLMGWVAFGLNFVSFRCAALLNPLTLNIAGNAKQVVTCLLGLVLFGGMLSLSLTIGILATAIGAYWYTQAMGNWRRSQQQWAALKGTDKEKRDHDDDDDHLRGETAAAKRRGATTEMMMTSPMKALTDKLTGPTTATTTTTTTASGAASAVGGSAVSSTVATAADSGPAAVVVVAAAGVDEPHFDLEEGIISQRLQYVSASGAAAGGVLPPPPGKPASRVA